MRSNTPTRATAEPASSESKPDDSIRAAAPAAAAAEQAAQGPIPAPVSVQEHPLPGMPANAPADAVGRRILSTAFVRVGPDGQLTVNLRDGRALLLRNVVMRPKDYCGEQVTGAASKKQFCGTYADVAEARPGDFVISE